MWFVGHSEYWSMLKDPRNRLCPFVMVSLRVFKPVLFTCKSGTWSNSFVQIPNLCVEMCCNDVSQDNKQSPQGTQTASQDSRSSGMTPQENWAIPFTNKPKIGMCTLRTIPSRLLSLLSKDAPPQADSFSSTQRRLTVLLATLFMWSYN